MTALDIERPSLTLGVPTAARLAATEAARADADRHLAPDVVAALADAGFARHFVPTRWGGRAGSFLEAGQAIAAVGEGCLSAAWCALIYATSARMAALLPPAGQADLWSDSPDTLVAAGLVPGGVAAEAPGGWLLSGTWRPVSGIDFADWVLLCAPVAGRDPGQLSFFAVPRGDVQVIDTWDTVGMRGTGSRSVAVSAAHVPTARMFRHAALLAGSTDPAHAACHRAPLLAVAPPLFLAPALGAARRALATWSAAVGARQAGNQPAAGASAYDQQVLAQSAAEIDVVDLLLRRALDSADAGRLTAVLAARNARDASHGAQLVVASVDRLFQAGAAAAQQSDNVLSRIWRDVHCATSHAALRMDRAAAHHARAVWGVTAP